jgi:hypothetical protein
MAGSTVAYIYYDEVHTQVMKILPLALFSTTVTMNLHINEQEGLRVRTLTDDRVLNQCQYPVQQHSYFPLRSLATMYVRLRTKYRHGPHIVGTQVIVGSSEPLLVSLYKYYILKAHGTRTPCIQHGKSPSIVLPCTTRIREGEAKRQPRSTREGSGDKWLLFSSMLI